MNQNMLLGMSLCLLLGLPSPVVTAAPPSSTVHLIRTKSTNRSGPGTRGPWRAGTSGVRLGRALKKSESAVWLPKTSITVGDGSLTLDMKVKEKTDLSLLLRVQWNAKRSRVTRGYRVHLAGKRLSIEVRVRGGWRRLDRKSFPNARRLFSKSGKTRPLRLTVTFRGPHLVVQAYGGSTQMGAGRSTPILELNAFDKSASTGGVGLLAVGRRASPNTLVTNLSYHSGCPTPSTGTHKSETPMFLTLNRTELARAQALSPSLKEMRETRRKRGTVVVAMNPIDVVALHCENVPIERVSDDRPWKYLEQWKWGSASYMLRGRGSKCPFYKDKTGRFSIDKSLKDASCVNHLLERWHETFPDTTRLETIGTSHWGTRIRAIRISNDIDTQQDKPTILLNGAHHGMEALSPEFVLDAIQYLLRGNGMDPGVTRWLDSFTIWAVPVVNPDGLSSFLERDVRMGRKNGRKTGRSGARSSGVDLNRNYPYRWGSLGERGSQSWSHSSYYRGEKPASEPEVRAMMALADREHFVASLTYHTGTLALLAPYTIDGAKNPTTNEAWGIAEDLVRLLPSHPERGRIKVKRKLYAVDGTDQDWHRHTHGTLALLVEGARRTPHSSSKRNAIIRAVRPIWQGLFDRFLDGPSLSGHVLDVNGRGVCAAVSIDSIRTREGERWMTRYTKDGKEGNGRFDRFLPHAGRVTVRVDVPHKPPVRRAVTIRKGNQQITIRLPYAVEPPPDNLCVPKARSK
jgi:hypothetical protein